MNHYSFSSGVTGVSGQKGDKGEYGMTGIKGEPGIEQKGLKNFNFLLITWYMFVWIAIPRLFLINE